MTADRDFVPLRTAIRDVLQSSDLQDRDVNTQTFGYSPPTPISRLFPRLISSCSLGFGGLGFGGLGFGLGFPGFGFGFPGVGFGLGFPGVGFGMGLGFPGFGFGFPGLWI